jgi:hypothetical protein
MKRQSINTERISEPGSSFYALSGKRTPEVLHSTMAMPM